MITTYVLRLVSDRLSGGETVGHAEEVDTGRTAIVHDLEHLLEFLLGDGGTPGGAAGPSRIHDPASPSPQRKQP